MPPPADVSAPAPGAPGIRPLPSGVGRPYAVWTLLAGGLGSTAILVAYLLLANDLAGSIAIHFDASGAPNGYAPPRDFLLGALAIEGFVTLLSAATLAWAARSPWRRNPEATRVFGPVTVLLVGQLLLTVPGSFVLVLFADSGRWPGAAPPVGDVTVGLALATLLLFVGLLGIAYRAAPEPARPLPESPVAGAGPVHFRCAACGATVAASRWALLGPRVGAPERLGGSDYYRRCPRCGELGWQKLVR